MVKFGQIMRITQDNKNATERLIDLVNTEPGLSSKALTKRLSGSLGSVSSNATRLAKAGRIKGIRQDGLIRYYPNNYLSADDLAEKHTCGVCSRQFINPRALRLHKLRVHTDEGKKWTGTLKAKPTTTHLPAKQSDLKQLAMEYIWVTGRTEDLCQVKDFVKWVEDRRQNND